MLHKKMIHCIQITTVLGRNMLDKKKLEMLIHEKKLSLQDGHFIPKTSDIIELDEGVCGCARSMCEPTGNYFNF